MKLTEELAWRGFVHQTTYKDPGVLDGQPLKFYWGVDPSADSMTVGHLAVAMMVKAFLKHGHEAVLLVGGATGLIGDPDGKSEERGMISQEEVTHNKGAIVQQYQRLFGDQGFTTVDNYDWFQAIGYLDFLRDVGKHVPTRQMLARDFVQTRLSEEGAGISYAEFSYVLIQAYDFLHLYEEQGVTLQVCGSDQWGNGIAGIDLIRRKTGGEAHVYSVPLITNPTTGHKFGKTEEGAVWLDPAKTTPTQFYQFWINVEDAHVEQYLKIYTELDRPEIENILADHVRQPHLRQAQTRLAQEATRLVHGEQAMQTAEAVTGVLTAELALNEVEDDILEAVRQEIPAVTVATDGSVVETLVKSGLASSNSEARRLISENAVSVNGAKISREQFQASDFLSGRLLLRKGKRFKDSILVELGQ